MIRRLVLLLLVCAVVAQLGACGRKGELEPPPGAEDSEFPRQYPR